MRRRGELMGEHGEGGMLALTLDVETARPLADRHYCQVASCNLPPARIWEVDYTPNATGTVNAYRPQGALERGGKRAAATGDYEAWVPEA